MRSYLLVGLLLLGIFGAIGGVMYWRASANAGDTHETPPVAVAAATARAESWEVYVDAVGTIGAVHGVDITSEESGVVSAVNFESGDQVAAGQLLIVLNDRLEQARRLNQLAALHLAQLVNERNATLLALKSIPQTQYDRSRADLEQAEARLAETEARLRNKRIHAPFAGTAGIRLVDLGDYISPGTVIASLQDLSALEVDFSVPAHQAAAIEPGFDVRLQAADDSDRSVHAVVLALDSKVDPATRNRQVRARLVPGAALVPGSFVEVRVALRKNREVVTVPETAVSYSLQGDTVYVIEGTDAKGGFGQQPRVVEVGETRAGRVAIEKGIEAGTRVVTAGQNKLFRGARVVVDESEEL